MDPVTLGIAGLGIGGASSLLGGLFGSKAASDNNKSMREALAMERDQQGRNMLRFLSQLTGDPKQARDAYKAQYGKDGYESMFGRAAAGPLSDAEKTELADLQREQANIQSTTRSRAPGGATRRTGTQAPSTGRLADIESRIRQLTGGRDAGKAGQMSEAEFDAMNSGPSLSKQYQDLVPQAQQQGRDLLSQFDTDSGQAMGLLDTVMNDAKQYGQRRIDQVGVDAGRALTGLNRSSMAQAAQSGIGSGSLMNQAMRGNQLAVRDQSQRQVNELEDGRLGLLTGLGQQRVGLSQGNAQQKLGIRAANSDRELGLGQQALNFKANALMSPIANPGLNVNTAPYMNMQSPLGTFGQSIAGFGSNVGGNLFGAAQSKLLEGLFAGKKGTGGP